MEFVKLFLLVLASCMIVNFIFAYRKLMKQQKIEFERIQEQREKYQTIDSQTFDQIPDEELTMAIVYRVWNKEDQDFENLFENLSDGEKTIYTIFLAQSAIENGRNTFANFFTEANQLYYPLLIDSYQKVECSKAVVVVLEKLIDYHNALMKEDDMLDFDVEEEAEPLPSYDLFTLDYLDAIKEDQLDEKLVSYIRKNKNDFVD